MRRIGYIYEKICSIENLNKALDKACQCEKEKHFVKKILDNREYYINQLHEKMMDETYHLNENTHKTIRERSSQNSVN